MGQKYKISLVYDKIIPYFLQIEQNKSVNEFSKLQLLVIMYQ